MGIFKFFSSRIPSKPRNKDLQTTGSVSVNVQKNVGMRTENASTIVQNVIAPENRKGKITITDLLQIPVAEIGANDTYLVYSSGSDEAGWHMGGKFEYDGEMYDDGTFFLWSIDRWVAVYKDNQTEEKQPTFFNPLQKFVSLITKTFAQSSYYNLPGRYKAGIPIAEVRKYELDDDGVYKEKTESQSGTYAAETSVMTLVVPFAKSYEEGGEMVYEGGALTAADYEKLCTGGGGQPQPSGGNVDDVKVNGASVVENRVANIDLAAYLNPYATQSWVSSQGFLKSVPSTYATQSWVQTNLAGYAVVRLLANGTDLNSVIQVGFYNAMGGHGCVNAHSAMNAFGMQVIHTAGGAYYTQIIYDYFGKVYRRFCKSGTWTAWKECVADWNETDQYAPGFVLNKPTIDTTAPATPSDDHVPSTKLLADQMKLVAEMFNGLANSKADKSALNNYYNKTEIDENYYNKTFLNLWIKSVPTKSDIEGMCKRIVVTSSKTFSVEELEGVAEILVKPSANMQIILPNDAVAIAGDRITISVIPANNTAGVDISTQTTTLFHNSSGYIATMSVTYIGSGWRLWGVQSTSI